MQRNYSPQLFILIFSSLFWGCSGDRKEKTVSQNIISPKPVNDSIHFHKLGKLFTTGDFDGDGKQDTLYQHNFSGITKAEIDTAPDPYQNEFDTLAAWFDRQDADIYLVLNKKNTDTLHLGNGQGLYCLINIGDNNADGKDEIALVIDHLDMSRINSCSIYSLCHDKWTEMKRFGIHEGAFDFTGDSIPVFKDIEGFLVRNKNQWVYSDYDNNDYNTAEEAGKMKKLIVGKCK